MIKGTTSNNVEVITEPRGPVVNIDKSCMAPAVIVETKEQYSLANVAEQYKQEIIASGEIDKLTSLIDVNNSTSIIEFGRKPAEEMAKVADQVLSKYDSASVTQVSTLVDSLLDVMKKVDLGEIKSAQTLMMEQAKKTFWDRFKKSAQEKLDALVGKYRTIGGDMEKICQQLTVYEQQIKSSNKDIAKMYDQAKVNYKNLTAYILAGEQAIIEIEQYRNNLESEYQATGNPDIQFDIQNVNQALSLMEQRVADLRGAEAVALQSVPIFKVQEITNANLARKVNSAFIVTVPAFKSALVNSVIAKQQAIQMQGLSALDEATSALIRKNAENAVQQLQRSQQLSNTSAIKADDIEYAWNTIMGGIQQYKEMEAAYKEIRKEEAQRITAANQQYLQSLAEGSAI